MPGLTTNISRRGVLAVAAAGAATVALVPLSPASADAPTAGQVPPVPASPPATLAELEATAMALKPPVFLLETVVPAQFSTSDKSLLSIVSEVHHTGNSSLRWDYKSRSVLTVQAPLGIVPPSAASGGQWGGHRSGCQHLGFLGLSVHCFIWEAAHQGRTRPANGCLVRDEPGLYWLADGLDPLPGYGRESPGGHGCAAFRGPL